MSAAPVTLALALALAARGGAPADLTGRYAAPGASLAIAEGDGRVLVEYRATYKTRAGAVGACDCAFEARVRSASVVTLAGPMVDARVEVSPDRLVLAGGDAACCSAPWPQRVAFARRRAAATECAVAAASAPLHLVRDLGSPLPERVPADVELHRGDRVRALSDASAADWVLVRARPGRGARAAGYLRRADLACPPGVRRPSGPRPPP
jgi:hypothetical protein